jgi:hypothetical protein
MSIFDQSAEGGCEDSINAAIHAIDPICDISCTPEAGFIDNAQYWIGTFLSHGTNSLLLGSARKLGGA